MKIVPITLPLAALATAAFLIGTPEESVGFTTIGGDLGPNQRDFRVFNNFTDATANNNTTADDNWPGFDGAEMAIWKACAEWASVLHGDGSGDSHQPGGVGSGGANFDPIFVGNANQVGGSNDNTHSQVSGCDGGVLAYCETPISDGWRIRYIECWNWSDGPGTLSGGIDLQGVACHEYGHALGLGHTNVSGATMYPSISSNGIPARSIAADDIAGVQFVYGGVSGSKPRITDVINNGSSVTIVGTGFSSNGNTVRFTSENATAGSSNFPVVVSNQSSSGGQITVTVPAAAGPGEVQVLNSGSGHTSVSNAYPFDPEGDAGCLPASNYCTSTTNSLGEEATMSFTGSQSVSANDFNLRVALAATNKFGLFFYGPSQVQQPLGDGFRCVGGSIQRLTLLQTDVFGTASQQVDLTGQPLIQPGTTWNFQFWFRDPQGPGGTGSNLSDGLSVPFCD